MKAGAAERVGRTTDLALYGSGAGEPGARGGGLTSVWGKGTGRLGGRLCASAIMAGTMALRNLSVRDYLSCPVLRQDLEIVERSTPNQRTPDG